MSDEQNYPTSKWSDAFKDPKAFAALLHENVVLEASAIRAPVAGRKAVLAIMSNGSRRYSEITFFNPAVAGNKTYSEWHAISVDGETMYDGVTVLTTDEAGQVVHVSIHHRPLDALLQFSAEMGEALRDEGMADQFYSAPQP